MKPINWTRVEEAMERSKRGVAQQGDFELCQTAFKRDEKEYARRSRAVSERVVTEERDRWK